MVGTIQVNCTPIRSDYKLNNIKHDAKVRFGSEKNEEPQDSLEVKKEQEQEPAAPAPEKSFSASNYVKEFGKGFFTPIKDLWDMTKSGKGIATLAIGGISVTALAAKVKSFKKYAVVAGSAVGVFNIGKGILKFAQADKAEDKEKSFHEMGKGTFYMVSSLWGAKNAAITAGVPNVTEKTGPFKALVQNCKSTGSDIVNLVKSVGKNDTLQIRKILGVTGATTAGVSDISTPDLPNNDNHKDTIGKVFADATGDEGLGDAIDVVTDAATQNPARVIALDSGKNIDEE